MAGMATFFWTIIFSVILFWFIAIVSGALLLIQYIKRRNKIKTKLKSNILLVVLSAVAVGVPMSFIPEWGTAFALFFLPIISTFILIGLEVAGIFIKK